ncbi:MAG: hypothetical protein IKZ87_03410 [Actinomycetaceae bacterium]|nr:hypothetical protein [Actinomycetaceae bacterium]
MQIKLNYRDKNWKQALAYLIPLLALSLFFLVFGIIYKETVLVVIFSIVTALFGFFIFLLLNPKHLACMQMVRGEMSYKELQQAIAAEDFKRIFTPSQNRKPKTFLVSHTV